MSAPTIAGDWNDDDGQVLDSLLDENTDGAKNPPPATEAFVPSREKPRVTTRILGTEIILTSGVITAGQVTTPSGAPVLVLPADPDRKSLHIHVNSLGTNLVSPGLGSDVVRFSDDPGKLMSKMGAPGVVTSQAVDGMVHTGPVWVFAPETNNSGAGGGMQLWVWSVTE